jgi:hypothetical protein
MIGRLSKVQSNSAQDVKEIRLWRSLGTNLIQKLTEQRAGKLEGQKQVRIILLNGMRCAAKATQQ